MNWPQTPEYTICSKFNLKLIVCWGVRGQIIFEVNNHQLHHNNWTMGFFYLVAAREK